MANTPRTDPLLAGTPTAEEIGIVDEALTAYECAHRYGASLEQPGPTRTAALARARTAARMLERLVNNDAGVTPAGAPGSSPGDVGAASNGPVVRDARADLPQAHDLNPVRNVRELRTLVAGLADDVPVRVHFGWDLAIAESGFDDDDGAVLLFPDHDAGVSPVSTAWARSQGLDA